MKIYFYHSGEGSEVNLQKINSAEVEKVIKELVKGTSEIMRSYVDEEGLNEIRKTESVIEVFFSDTLSINSNGIGTLKFKKIFIPLTGDYAGTDESPVATVFIGDEVYFSNPFRNPEGFPLVKRLQEEIKTLP